MRNATIYIEWSELFANPIPDDLIDLWTAGAHGDQALAQAMSATSVSYQQAHPDLALRLLDVVGEVDAVHDVDVALTIMQLAQSKSLDEWAPTIRHHPDRIAQLNSLVERDMRIGIVSDSVWSRIWIDQFLTRDAVPYHLLVVANEGNYKLHRVDAWGEAIIRLGPGQVICGDETKAIGAHEAGLQVHQWDYIDDLIARF